MAKTNNELKQYNDIYSYKILENGYEIYAEGARIVTQFDQYSHVYKADGTFEENALIQLEELEAMRQESIKRAAEDAVKKEAGELPDENIAAEQ